VTAPIIVRRRLVVDTGGGTRPDPSFTSFICIEIPYQQQVRHQPPVVRCDELVEGCGPSTIQGHADKQSGRRDRSWRTLRRSLASGLAKKSKRIKVSEAARSRNGGGGP
jgi:hypothetical protein